jgi:hypothetical protein
MASMARPITSSGPGTPSRPVVPSRLGRLSATEQRVWNAFPHGETVDLSTGDPALDDPTDATLWSADRDVRGEVVAALLLGACQGGVGAVPAVRLTGARITGELRVDHGQITSPLVLWRCRFEGAIELDGAVTGSIDLRGSSMTVLNAYGAQVRGTLDLRDTVLTGVGGQAVHADGIQVDGSLFANRTRAHGTFCLINAHVGGQVTFIAAELLTDVAKGKSLNAGGIRVGRSFLAQALRTRGEVRLPGAHIGSSLLFNGARLNGFGASALYADDIMVASEATFRTYTINKKLTPFTAIGPVHLAGGRFGSDLILAGVRLRCPRRKVALNAERIVVDGTLQLTDGLRTKAEIRLTGARIKGHLELTGMASPDALLSLYSASVEGGIHEDVESWPMRLDLDGFTYGPFSHYLGAGHRIALIQRQIRKSDGALGSGYRAQPYEQLASYYRGLGNDGEARTVLLAKQRALRSRLPRLQRLPGHLLDVLVGYGYRPLRAIGWAVTLLTASSVYFDQVRPEHVATDDTSVFNPVLYAADHLVPIIHFGQPDVWEYHGFPELVTAVLTVLGWTLGIAIAAAASRTLTRN